MKDRKPYFNRNLGVRNTNNERNCQDENIDSNRGNDSHRVVLLTDKPLAIVITLYSLF
jgi:hypothetical protein